MLVYELDKIFNKISEHEVWIGAELEVYVLSKVDDDYEDRYTINISDSVVEEIYNRMDERIYRDYYPYQLEIRTYPHNDPNDTAKELIELFKEASDIAQQFECKLVPISYLEKQMYNGMHVHISYSPKVSNREMVKRIVAVYPFIFDVARLTLSSPIESNEYGKILSIRNLMSPHIGIVPIECRIEDLEYMWVEDIKYDSTKRYYDIALNTNEACGRVRIKNVNTIEVRLYDSIGSIKAIKDVLELTYYMFKYIEPSWINKYRESYSRRRRLQKICDMIRYNMLLARNYINPFTGTDAQTLAEHFALDITTKEPWICYMYPAYDEFCTIKYQSNIEYPVY